MKTETISSIPQLSDFPEPERTESLKVLLELCQRQQEHLSMQSEQLALQREQI